MKAFLRSLVAPVIAALLAAGAANAAFWQWSTTSATNATADPSINWAEGMSPSSVNDSARAMMSALAKWRLDISGSISTAGTATAYTLTTNSAYVPTVGTVVSFFAHTSNGIAATLNVDGNGAKPFYINNVTAAPEGVITSGATYSVLYCASCNGGSGAWLLQNYFGNQFNIPLGAVISYSGTTVPNANFVFANGQCISRTTYAAYFAMVSTTYGACDGVSTFGVPDLRERVTAFQGTMGGASTPSRITVAGSNVNGTVLGAGGGAQAYTIAQANLPAVTLTTSIADGQGAHIHTAGNPGSVFLMGVASGGNATRTGPAGNEGEAASTNASTLPAMTGTTPLGGSGSIFTTLPPVIMLTAIVRVL